MKKVLVVSYYFSPIATSGTVRIVKLLKYLHLFGWEPSVLTVKKNYHHLSDESYFKDIPSSTKIFRTFHIEPRTFFRRKHPSTPQQESTQKDSGKIGQTIISFLQKMLKFFLTPDELIFWIPFAVLKGIRVIKKEKINIVFASSPPPSALIIAYLLKKITKCKLVIDLRDEWIQDPFSKFPTKIHSSLNKYIAKHIYDQSDRIIIATPTITSEIMGLGTDGSKIQTITNGYDDEDYVFSNHVIAPNEKFTVLYTGMFNNHRTPYFFLQAVKTLLVKKLISSKDIKIIFRGHINTDTYKKDLIDDPIFKDVLVLESQVPHDENIASLQRSDALLLVISTKSGEGSYSGKLFEYLAARKPILALIPPNGLAAKVITKTNTGYVVEPENIEEISKTYLRAYTQWKQNQLSIQPNISEIEKYSRKNIARDFSNAFDSVI